jgi:hypothetical protein
MTDHKELRTPDKKKTPKTKIVSYDNVRTCLFKNLLAVFLNGHGAYGQKIARKFDDMPIRYGDGDQGYVIDFNTQRYGFSDDEYDVYEEAVNVIMSETHALLLAHEELQKVLGVQPKDGQILIQDEEALFALVGGLCERAPHMTDIDEKPSAFSRIFSGADPQSAKRNPVFTLNQLLSLSDPILSSQFNDREERFNTKHMGRLPFAMNDIYAFMKKSDPRTRAGIPFTVH